MHSKAFLCLAFGFLVVVNGQDPTTVPTTSAPPTTPTTTPSTTTPTTTPSTTAPTTTPSTTTPTTTSPTTPSTTTAQTTTKATTTSTAAPTTSTAAPTTTTPKPTTPTPTPTPKPLPTPPPPPSVEVGTWNVTKNGTEMCLKAQFGLLLLVPYVTTDGRTVNGSVAVPPSATAAGDCSSLMLVWGGNSSSNFVTMKFEQITPVNKTKPEFRLQQITATLAHDAERFPNATDESAFSITLRNAAEVFEAPVNSSYRCHSEQQFRANSTVPAPAPVNGTIPATVFLFKELQLQPFMAGASTGFGSATTCAADRELTSDVVPIAVGCALAGLVVVVIVAYIIGRRRSRQNGYTSV